MLDSKSDEELAEIWGAFAVSFPRSLFVMGYWEGRQEATRNLILRQGRKKFGPPTQYQEATVTAMLNLDHLEALAWQLLDVNTWDELLTGS
jgi:hypothetical protein